MATSAAIAWRHAQQERPCDLVVPWDFGTVVKASRHPGFYFHNAIRVEGDLPLGADELVAFADRALGEPCHLISVDSVDVGERLRSELEDRGWLASRLALMRREAPQLVAGGPGADVAEVDYADVYDLRVKWHLEDFPGVDPTDYLAAKAQIDRESDCTVLAVREGQVPVGFIDVLRAGSGAEIASAYVEPPHRGRGIGTAMLKEAVRNTDVRDLWISADADGRAKTLYERLGFRAAWFGYEFIRFD